MKTKHNNSDLFKHVSAFVEAAQYTEAQLFINGLEQEVLEHFSRYISIQMIEQNTLKELIFSKGSNFTYGERASLYVEIFISMQSFFESSVVEKIFAGSIAAFTVEEKQSHCFSMLKTLNWMSQIKDALAALPDTEQLLRLNIVHKSRGFLHQVETLASVKRFEILNSLVPYLPEILSTESDVLSDMTPLSKLLSLLKPSEGLTLLIHIADARGIVDFSRTLGSLRHYLTRWASTEKLTEIKKHIVSEVALHNLALVEDELDDFLIAKTQLTHYLHALKEKAQGCERSLQEDYQHRIDSTSFFLEVLHGNPRFHTTLESYYEHKNNCKGTILEDYLKNPALKKLVGCLERDLIREAARRDSSSDSDDTSSTFSEHGRSLFFSQKKVLIPHFRGLRSIDILPGDNSFFIGFNVARRLHHTRIDDTVMRAIIAREMLKNPSEYTIFFNNDLRSVVEHAKQFKSFDLGRGAYQNLYAGLFHINTLSEILRVPIIVIAARDNKSMNAVHFFSSEFLKKTDPVFLYQCGTDYTALELTGEYPLDAILDDLQVGTLSVPLGLV